MPRPTEPGLTGRLIGGFTLASRRFAFDRVGDRAASRAGWAGLGFKIRTVQVLAQPMDRTA